MKQYQFIKDFESYLQQEANIFLIIKRVLFNPIYLFSVISVFPISIFFLISKLWEVYQIKRDLKGKHYIPLQMKVVKKEYKEGDDMTTEQYCIQLEQLTPTNLLSKYAQKRLASQAPSASFNTNITVDKQIYYRLEVNHTPFFLVGHHSKKWMCRGNNFINIPFGDHFF